MRESRLANWGCFRVRWSQMWMSWAKRVFMVSTVDKPFSSGTHLVHSQHVADPVRPWPFPSEQFTCCVQPPWRGILHSPRQGWLLLRRPEEHLPLKDRKSVTRPLFSICIYSPDCCSQTIPVVYLSQKMSFLPYLQEYFQSRCQTVHWCQKHIFAKL